ncbi:hypothetical protein B2G71_09145 [Novosphingobium sp. PC22D]|uniref:DUF3089 domain-containing protein n=1 Tax=Novosphingobium sp. PC22D TaxID=1962403 RepID=UPI000BF09524|nr:DUF3089 domain-containing protein [Novosphingobium sp. PC22D]PEQ12989.1 hypothetical protein B2G71_09145 [Novosphingobium sp. PC22D]
MARKFLYVVAGLTVLVFAVLVALRLFAEDLTRFAFVPDEAFTQPPPADRPDYAEARFWIARPGLESNPAQWRPRLSAPNDEASTAPQSPAPEAQQPDALEPLPVSVFFVHPTSFISRDAWNGPIDEPTARTRAELFVRGMGSPFGQAAHFWAPRYRQATIGAFLTDDPRAMMALDLAYADVLAAFDTFVRETPPDEPIVLAGHSQGAFILRRLLKDRVAGQPLADRVAAAYVIGWPVSITHDLPAMGLPACERADDTGCIVSWLSFADPAETDMLREAYSAKPGLDGKPVGTSPFVCVNPISGVRNGSAEAARNLGTLVPDFETEPMAMDAELVAGVVPARCERDDLLHIGDPPDLDLGPYVLPGNNYHLYDIPLFWANLREDFRRRMAAWEARTGTPR